MSPAIGGQKAAGNRRGDSTQIAALTQMRHAPRARKSHREIRLGAADCQKAHRGAVAAGSPPSRSRTLDRYGRP